MNYVDQQAVLRKAAKLSTRQGLLFRNHLTNFIADHPEDWLNYLPTALGGGGQSLDDTHLKHIKKYTLLITLTR